MIGDIRLASPNARWSLAQALAWALSRDIAFVEALAPDREPATTYTHLIVKVRAAGFSGSFGDAERELIASIADGKVAAEGEPGRSFDSRQDRQPIGERVKGLEIEDGSSGDADGWLLLPKGEQQSRWYDVTVDAVGLRRCLPGSQVAEPLRRNSGGRPEKFDWATIRAHVFVRLDHHGMPSCTDPEWSSQADVDRCALDFCRQIFDREPGESTLRKRVSAWLREFEAGARS